MVVHSYWSTCLIQCVVLSKVKIFQIDFKMDLKWPWDKKTKKRKHSLFLTLAEGTTPSPPIFLPAWPISPSRSAQFSFSPAQQTPWPKPRAILLAHVAATAQQEPAPRPLVSLSPSSH